MGGWRFCAFGAKVPQSTVSPMIQQQTLYLGGKVMLDHKKKTSLDKGTQRKTTENELPSLTQCTA